MRLLLITTSYPNVDDGSAAAGAFVQDFAEALANQNADVEIIAPITEYSAKNSQTLKVTHFRVPRLPLSLLNPRRPAQWPAIVKTLIKGQETVLEACAHHRPDHILALWALPSGAWARRAAQQYSVPYSVWALGSDIWSLGRFPIVRNYLAGVLRTAAHRYADGIKLAADVRRISGRECGFMPSSRLFGPASQHPPRSAPPYRFAFLGRWHPHKGPDLLLDALAQLTNSDWANIDAVHLGGGGPLESSMQQQVKALIAAGRPVQLDGYLNRKAARDFFEWADYIVIPSRIESIPVVYSDAMQMRRPIIAMPVGDLPELIDRFGCGILASEVSASGLSQAMHQALNIDPNHFSDGLGKAAENFKVQTAATGFLHAIMR